MAVLTAMNFALAHGLDEISIQSDSQILINKKEKKLDIYGVLTDIYRGGHKPSIWYFRYT